MSCAGALSSGGVGSLRVARLGHHYPFLFGHKPIRKSTETMTMNPKDNWGEFRDHLFDMIESRPDIASTFKHSAVYFFICRSKTAFTSPGTQKAEEALDEIADDGSFRLVKGSLSDFLTMFQVAEQPAIQDDRPHPSGDPGQAKDHATAQLGTPKEEGSTPPLGRFPREDSADSARRNQDSNPTTIRRAAETQENPARAFGQLVPARSRSGPPFRRGEGAPAYD